MSIPLDAIRDCLEGMIPAAIATASPDGTPNTTMLSQVQYVDAGHVALSYQFFNKTRRNILSNPRGSLMVISPITGIQYRLAVEYLRTETEGPLFECMKAKLAAIASHTGMSGVFRLLGSDIYRVLDIQAINGGAGAAPAAPGLPAALRASTLALAGCADLEGLLAETLASLDRHFGIAHAMILMSDADGSRLYTVASHGYAASGIGSEIAVGDGVIGVAARDRTPVRIAHLDRERAYGRYIRTHNDAGATTEIPLPGLSDPHSQLALPILGGGRLLGVLFVESEQALRFTHEHEDILASLANQLAVAMFMLANSPEADGGPATAAAAAAPAGNVLRIRRYAGNDSIFLNDEYLIKGVAGAIFWHMLRDYTEHGRIDHSNRELRVDPRLRLPDLDDNLEVRLIMLARRLAERDAGIRLDKTGRGRLRLAVARPIELQDMS